MTELLLVVAVSLAGGLGAGLRYLVELSIPEKFRKSFPWAILLINFSGSFLLGFLTGLALETSWILVITAGLLGGYTTFSTTSLDSVKLMRARRYLSATFNVFGMLFGSLALASFGIVLGAVF